MDCRKLLKHNAIPDLLKKEDGGADIIDSDPLSENSELVEFSPIQPICSTYIRNKSGLEEPMQPTICSNIYIPEDSELVEFSSMHPICNTYIPDVDDSYSSEMQNLLTTDYPDQQQLINDLRTNLKKLMHERNQYKYELDCTRKILQTRYNEDQIYYMKNGNAIGQLWSENTMKKAIKLYLSCGKKGYEEIKRQNLPFPSIVTIQRRLRNNQFNPGMLYIFILKEFQVSISHMYFICRMYCKSTTGFYK